MVFHLQSILLMEKYEKNCTKVKDATSRLSLALGIMFYHLLMSVSTVHSHLILCSYSMGQLYLYFLHLLCQVAKDRATVCRFRTKADSK